MKRRIMFVMLVLFCSCALVFAAGSKEPADASSSSKVTLRFSWWGGEARHKATLEAIDVYQKANPNVVIEPEYQGYDGYEAKLATQIAGNTAPDLIQIIQTRLVEFGSKNDIFVDFKEQDILDYSLWDESFRGIYGKVGTKLVGLSTGVNSYNIHMNKTMLDRLGIPMPNQDITWAEFLELGRKIQKADPNSHLLSADKDSLNLLMRAYIRQKTGEFYIRDDFSVLEDEKPYIEFFTMLRQWYDEGIIEPIETGFPYWGKLEQNRKWIQGQIACMYAAASSIPGVKQANMEIVPINLPQTPGSSFTGIVTQPAQIFAVKKGPNQDETLKFLKWLYTSEEGALIVKDSRGVPPTQFQRDLLASSGQLDVAISSAVNMAMPKTDKPVPALSENSQIYQVCQSIVEQVAFNAMTPAQAAKEIIRQSKSVLAELKRAAQ